MRGVEIGADVLLLHQELLHAAPRTADDLSLYGSLHAGLPVCNAEERGMADVIYIWGTLSSPGTIIVLLVCYSWCVQMLIVALPTWHGLCGLAEYAAVAVVDRSSRQCQSV